MSRKDIIIRNNLIMPANNPAMLLKSTCFNSDLYTFDLEDAVHFVDKSAARRLVVKTINSLGYKNDNITIRVNNDTPQMLEEDISAVANLNILGLFIPKVKNKKDIELTLELLDKYTIGKQNNMSLMVAVEDSEGVFNAKEIAGASDRIIAMVLGAGDYTSSLGATLTESAEELVFGRSMVINACALYGIIPLDHPHLDLDDEEGLINSCIKAKSMGFKGKIAINPRQIETINKVFTPSDSEIRWAQRIISALESSESGVLSVDGKMIDIAITKKAEVTLAIAKKMGVL